MITSPNHKAQRKITASQLRIARRLGRGGMAEVFLAYEPGGRPVVLKRILPELASASKFINMFLDEANLASQLEHPSICAVHDFGISRGRHFLTMEYVHGDDLRFVLAAAESRAQRVPLREAIYVLTRVAAGLHFAHEHVDPSGQHLGIVHRDVNPSNIMVGYDGSVKLLDFGIAKAVRRRTDTTAGRLKGKIAYMSPEQCRGKAIDRRSDVFSLGIVAYELLCGRQPFAHDDEVVTLNRIVNEDAPPPTAELPDFPSELERIILRALQRRPDDRYPTTLALARDLSAFCRQASLAPAARHLASYLASLLGDRTRRGPTDPTPEDFDTETTVRVDKQELDALGAAAPPADRAPPQPGSPPALDSVTVRLPQDPASAHAASQPRPATEPPPARIPLRAPTGSGPRRAPERRPQDSSGSHTQITARRKLQASEFITGAAAGVGVVALLVLIAWLSRSSARGDAPTGTSTTAAANPPAMVSPSASPSRLEPSRPPPLALGGSPARPLNGDSTGEQPAEAAGAGPAEPGRDVETTPDVDGSIDAPAERRARKKAVDAGPTVADEIIRVW